MVQTFTSFLYNQNFGFPSYLSNLISSGIHSYNTQNLEDVVVYIAELTPSNIHLKYIPLEHS